MASILKPGYLRWDGSKFVLDPSVEIVGPPGPSFTAGGDLSGDAVSQTVIGLQGHAVSSEAPTDQYLLTYSTSAGKWRPLPLTTGLTISGDLAGTVTSQQVISLTGSGGLVNVPSSTSIQFGNTLTAAQSGILRLNNIYNTTLFGILTARDTTNNVDVPIISSFGADNGTTEIIIGSNSSLNTLILNSANALQINSGVGGVHISGNVTATSLSTGVVHSGSGGLLTSSTIVNADVSASAAIAVSKLANGTTGQVLVAGASVPAYGAVDLANSSAVTGILPTAHMGKPKRSVRVIATSATLTTADDILIFSASGQTATLPSSPSVGDKYTVGCNFETTSATYSVVGPLNSICAQGTSFTTFVVTTTASAFQVYSFVWDGANWIAGPGY